MSVGCYYAPGNVFPPFLKEMILTERDQSSAVWDGQLIEWNNWDKYMIAFLHRCAKKAVEKGYRVFGVR